MRRIREKAFTLIELLVVISIIALLLSILMPALSKVKNQARVVVCKSNLRQLSTALETYTADHGNKALSTNFKISDLPPVWAPHMWFLVLAPYLSDNKYKDDPTAVLEGSMKTLWCPSTKEPFPAGGFGDSKHRWRFHVVGYGGEGSYGINTWVGGMDIGVQVDDFKYIKPGQARRCSLRNMSARSDTPVFADSPWMEGIPMDLSQSMVSRPQGIPPYMDDSDYNFNLSADDFGMRRFCFDRHNMAINISFADGSVNKVKLEDLWSLKWNKSFKTINKVDLK